MTYQDLMDRLDAIVNDMDPHITDVLAPHGADAHPLERAWRDLRDVVEGQRIPWEREQPWPRWEWPDEVQEEADRADDFERQAEWALGVEKHAIAERDQAIAERDEAARERDEARAAARAARWRAPDPFWGE